MAGDFSVPLPVNSLEMFGVLDDCEPLVVAFDFDSCSVNWRVAVQRLMRSDEVMKLVALEYQGAFLFEPAHDLLSVADFVHLLHLVIVNLSR